MSEKQSDPRFYALRDAVVDDRAEAKRMIDADPSCVHARNSIGETALHYLAVEDMLDAVEWLAACGADIDTRNDFGGTPLTEASQLGYLEMCRFLLRNGADIFAKDMDGGNAVSAAASGDFAANSDTALLEMLIAAIGDTDINDMIDEDDIESIVRNAHPNVVSVLQKHGLQHRTSTSSSDTH